MYGICSSQGDVIPFYTNILCVSVDRNFAHFNICGRSRNAKWWLLRLIPGCERSWQVCSRSLPTLHALHARTIPCSSIMKCRPGFPGAVSGVFASVHRAERPLLPAGRPLLPAACMLTAPPGTGAGRKGANVELGLINETHVIATDKTPTINPWKQNVAII